VNRAARTAALAAAATLAACGPKVEGPGDTRATVPPTTQAAAAFWNSGTVYFLLTDRFENGDPANDTALGRKKDGALLRNFEGGDLRGLLRRIEEGYFDSLGVTAIWMTPFVEQIHAAVDEGTGRTYGYHGYWTRDWTMVDPALGTLEDLRAVVDAAHRHGIRVLMDAVINHPGPVTDQDPAWPAAWVRTRPQCTYRSYASTTDCTLVPHLPDVRTGSDMAAGLPDALVEKWRSEGRLERERAELEAFFRRTGYPRAPRYYLIKWLTDWVRDVGFDGYRVDTAKHFFEGVSTELKHEAEVAYEDWKREHPDAVPQPALPFYMMGEVYGYGVGPQRAYDFGDRQVDYYTFGYDGLINFGFKADAAGDLDSLFTRYAATLGTGAHRGVAILNYVSSHDDGGPFDRERSRPFDAGTRLLLAPGGAQIYYGDESARPLVIQGAEGDANLRGMMNWSDQERGPGIQEILRHWRRLGRFRRAHPAIGAGEHRRIQASPYVFSRTLDMHGRTDRVVVGLDMGNAAKTVPVGDMFPNGTRLTDSYSGVAGVVRNGSVTLTTRYGTVLLAEDPPARR
jgi:alpha-amylase